MITGKCNHFQAACEIFELIYFTFPWQERSGATLYYYKNK